MASASIPRISEEDYLRLERAAETKSEFVGGEIFAMAGGTAAHCVLATRWGGLVMNSLEGRKCYVFSSDLRIRTQSTGSYVYPDVSVVCGKPKFYENSNDILTNPVVIIEVLSPTTEPYDRGK